MGIHRVENATSKVKAATLSTSNPSMLMAGSGLEPEMRVSPERINLQRTATGVVPESKFNPFYRVKSFFMLFYDDFMRFFTLFDLTSGSGLLHSTLFAHESPIFFSR